MSKQLPMVHLQAVDLLTLIKPHQFCGLDTIPINQLVGMLIFAVALAIKPNTHHVADLTAVGCN